MGEPFLDLTTVMLWFDFPPAREEMGLPRLRGQ